MTDVQLTLHHASDLGLPWSDDILIGYLEGKTQRWVAVPPNADDPTLRAAADTVSAMVMDD